MNQQNSTIYGRQTAVTTVAQTNPTGHIRFFFKFAFIVVPITILSLLCATSVASADEAAPPPIQSDAQASAPNDTVAQAPEPIAPGGQGASATTPTRAQPIEAAAQTPSADSSATAEGGTGVGQSVPVTARQPAAGVQVTEASPNTTTKGGPVTEKAPPSSDEELTLEFKARLLTGWSYEREQPDEQQFGEEQTEFGLFVDQARLGVDAEWDNSLRLQIEFELSSANDPPAGMRDAWLNWRFSKALQVRLGRLKRPFSRLELKGAGDLPVRGRGLGNSLLVEDMGYGERALTGQLHGRVKALKLDWAVSVSNPPPDQSGADLHARLAVDVARWLELGGSVAHKIVDDPGTLEDDFIAGSGYNVDVRVKAAGLYMLVDGLVAEDLRFGNRPLAGVLAGYATYDIPLTDVWALQPVVFGEWADSDLEFSGSEAVRFIAGINAVWRDSNLRIMPQVEVVRPLQVMDTTLWVRTDAFYVMLGGQI